MYYFLKLILPEACDRGLLLVLLSYLLFRNSTSTLNKKTYHLPTWNVTRALPQVQKLCGKQRNNLQQCISYLLKCCISNKTHFLCLSAYIFFDQLYAIMITTVWTRICQLCFKTWLWYSWNSSFAIIST